MNRRQFAAYLRRDRWCYCGCGGRDDTLVPQHRAGRGMGGSKALDRPANIMVLCAEVNGLIESDAEWAARARRWGWKLYRWQTPEDEPLLDRRTGTWWKLREDGQRDQVPPPF